MYIYRYRYMYIYLSMYVCACVRVCVSARLSLWRRGILAPYTLHPVSCEARC